MKNLTTKIKRIFSFILNEEKDSIYVDVNNTHFKVMSHWFWNGFKKEAWEPSTYKLMSKYIKKDKSYVDIGTWIGPTILYATEIGADKIYGVEANPLTFKMVSKNSGMNQLVADKLNLYNICITDTDGGLVDFGGKRGADTSSASSLRGNEWKIPSSTILSWLKQNKIENYNFLKIDIEGAEKFIEKDLVALSETTDLAILLSLHPPFWDDKEAVSQTVLNMCSKYDIFDIDEKPMDLGVLKDMVLTNNSKPNWGTKHGNFFEILLKSK